MILKKYYEFIDGIKGIGILLIVFVHWGAYSDNSFARIYSVYGAKAVEMFIIVSTFLSCKSYAGHYNSIRLGC